MYSVVIFFSGPATKWGGRISDMEVIARRESPWLWLARWSAQSLLSTLNANRCGYAILRGGEQIETVTQ